MSDDPSNPPTVSSEYPPRSDDRSNPATVGYEYPEAKPTVLRRAPDDPSIGEGYTMYEYLYEHVARAFAFEHDAAHGVFRLTSPDGTTEAFRDKPVRYLCVEPDETGAMRPVRKLGRPVFVYLAREEREVR